MAHGYFVAPEMFEVLQKQFAPGIFDTDFPRGPDVYQLFNREYSWSPGYRSVFQSCCFEAEIEVGEKKLIKETVALPSIVYTEEGDFEFKVAEQEVERLIPDDVIRVKVIPAYSHLLWEEEYDALQDDTTSFDVPCKEIIDCLHLEQKEHDGYYFNSDGELVCFDASLSEICDGLLIRKDYLEQFLVATGLKLFWMCTGEKQFFQGELNQTWKRWEGFIYYEQNQIHGSFEPVEEN